MLNSKMTIGLSVIGFILSGYAMATPEPIAQFNFNSIGSDNKTFEDITGNGHDATYNRVVSITSSNPFDEPSNKSVSQTVGSGAGTYCIATNPGSIDLTAGGTSYYSMSMEGWLNFSSWDPSGNARPFAVQSSQGGTTNISLTVSDAGSVTAIIYIKSGPVYNITSTSFLSLNTWNHLALVDNNGLWTLYINGESEGTVTCARSLPNTLTTFQIGGSSSETMLGKIDDIGLYSNALSISELGYYNSYVPEPMTIGILTVGAFFVMRKRR